MLVRSLDREDALEEEIATHSNIPAWRMDRSLAGYSPWGYKELDTTEHSHTLGLIYWEGNRKHTGTIIRLSLLP